MQFVEDGNIIVPEGGHIYQFIFYGINAFNAEDIGSATLECDLKKFPFSPFRKAILLMRIRQGM